MKDNKDNLVEIKNLCKIFTSPQMGLPVYALKDIHLAIPRSSIYGIIGMSGAGKSTLLRCLTGLETPTEGTLFFDGKEFPYRDRKALESLRKQIGMVFQHFQLFSAKTVGLNIAYPLEISNAPLVQRQQRVEELLSIVGLQSKKDHYPSQLSGGEKQRVGIARALAAHPRLLLCDEPTSALDPKTTRDLLQLLTSLNQELGITIVMITHQLETIKQACQRVAVLSQGQIVEEGEVKDIFTKPKHPMTQHLLHLGVDQFPHYFFKPQAGAFLVRLGFEGCKAKQPVISYMIKHFDIEVNILSGGLDYLQDTIVGHLFVELSGSSEKVERALAFLRSQHIICERLK